MIYLGSCEDILPTLASDTFDGIVTDPPYGLGQKEPTVSELEAYLQGESGLKTGDFMGAKWDIPSVAVWKECFRVLKPGGLLFSFGGTRTIDIISLGIQAAGFTKLGSLLWVHGQGWAKGGDVGKAIDKSKGATRKVIGKDPEAGRRNKKTPRFNGNAYAGGEVWQGAPEVPLTEPATEEAQLWDGWGSQLKPAWEPIFVYSKGSPTRSIDFSEPFIYCAKAARKETTLGGRLVNNHNTKKPLKLMRKLVALASKPGDLVLDPYLGSGTTAVACLEEGYRYVGIERDQDHHALATERLRIVENDKRTASSYDVQSLLDTFPED